MSVAEADKERAEIQLRSGRRTFDELLSLAEASTLKEHYVTGAALAQIAARIAFPTHVGLFSSPRLERVLALLADSLPRHKVRTQRRIPRREVLHVLTYARPTGGDTRSVWRWIRADPESRHSVAVTSQAHFAGVYDIPSDLTRAVADSGGRIHILGASAASPLKQAAELRPLASDADVVFLNLWPHDIVPSIALGADCDTPTYLVNQSDHTFWIGAGVSHAIIHLRDQPSDFLQHRRHLAQHRGLFLPIPLELPPQIPTKAEARQALGLHEETVVLLTIASPFKFSGEGAFSLLDLVEPVISTSAREVVLMAVGPVAEGPWESARKRCAGRFRPLGTRYDNDELYAAADIYLDSAPFSSSTSMLEAGLRGVPVVAFRNPDADLALLGPGAPGLSGVMVVASEPADYRTRLQELIDDRHSRQSRGQATRTKIVELHAGRGWMEALEALYRRAESRSTRGCLLQAEDSRGESSLDLALLTLYGSATIPGYVRGLARNYIGELPYSERLAVSRALWRAGIEVSYLNLLPPPLNAVVRRVGKPVRRTVLKWGEGLRR